MTPDEMEAEIERLRAEARVQWEQRQLADNEATRARHELGRYRAEVERMQRRIQALEERITRAEQPPTLVVPTLADLGPLCGATAWRWYYYRDATAREWRPALVDGWASREGKELLFVTDCQTQRNDPLATCLEHGGEFAIMPPPPEDAP
jgi:hypothetical protein